VPEDLIDGDSFLGVLLEDGLQEADALGGDLILEGGRALTDLSLQLRHVACLEGHGPVEHCVQDHTRAPHIARVALVPVTLEDFRGYVGGCAALFLHGLARAGELADTEITDLDVALGGQQDVVQLDVAMQDALRVAVAQTLHYLLKQVLSNVFLELPTTTHVREQVTSPADFHDEHYVLRCLEGLVETDDVSVSCPLEYVELLHDLPLRCLLG